MKKLMAFTIQATLVAMITACGSGGGSSSTPRPPTPVQPVASISEKYQGVWLAPAYGDGLKVTANQAEAFHYAGDFCLNAGFETDISDADIEAVYRLTAGQLENFGEFGTADFHAPSQFFTKASALPAACADGYDQTLGDSGYTNNPIKDLELFYQIFKQYSVSIEAQNADWDGLYATALNKVSNNTSATDLFVAMAEMIQPLQDAHTKLRAGDEFVEFTAKKVFVQHLFDEWLNQNNLSFGTPLSESQFSAVNDFIATQIERYNDIILTYADDENDIKLAANNQVFWFSAGDIGYLNVLAMAGFADSEQPAAQLAAIEEAIDQAITDLQDTKGLIIDVRTNNGGHDYISLAIASRFVGAETQVYKKQAGLADHQTPISAVTIKPRGAIQYLKPVVLLVSATTVSAAETFTLAMSALDNVTLMGEASQGAFSDVLERTLFNDFEVKLSNEKYFSIDDVWYEGQGVPVDVSVPVFLASDRATETDSVLEAAAARLNN